MRSRAGVSLPLIFLDLGKHSHPVMSEVVEVFSISSSVLILLLSCLPNHFDLNANRQRDGAERTARGDQSTTPATTPATTPVPLEFREFFEPSAPELKPSAKLLGLSGKRVRLVGFMAQMEKPPTGVFYLCSHPVYCDESGGGTADLPIEHVRVIVRKSQGKAIPFISRPVEVTGILEIGNREEDDGTISAIRLILDGPQTLSRSPQISPSKQKRKTSSKN